jgi:uncharacterized protein YdhG (YjbR/CyaY superfamily)
MTTDEVDDYLAKVSDEDRAALEALRRTIRQAAPEATETISYGVPTFKHHGGLVGFGAGKSHCSLYVMSTSAMDTLVKDLAGFDTSKGTVRFSPDEPLPAALVKKIVKTRIKENEARR